LFVTFVHVPSADAPCATEHAWHAPLHAAEQQKPSTHGLVPHSRHPETLQSATKLHVPPTPLLGMHVPADVQ